MRRDDQLMLTFLAAVLALLVGLAVRPSSAAEPGLVVGDFCDSAGDARWAWTDERKRATRERVRGTVEALGASELVVAYHDAVVCREAFCGEASVRHVTGRDEDGVVENGLGPHGLSLRWHADKWPGEDEDPAFCTPEVSAVVAHELIWRAVTRYGARNIVEVQSVYAGAVERDGDGWRFTLSNTKRRRLCERMQARGHRCDRQITERDLGRRLGEDERREWALALARMHVAELNAR